MKIKIMHQINGHTWDDQKGPVPHLEDQVNEFIKTKHVIDIKYTNTISMAANDYGSSTDFDESVLIMYEDK